MKKSLQMPLLVGAAAIAVVSEGANAACFHVPRAALVAAAATIAPAVDSSGGLNFHSWVTMVDETGKVCHVVNTNGPGANSNDAWLGSRIISAQKANTANAFSTRDLALSTANLYSAVQPGGSLFGLQHSNPVDASIAYQGSPKLYGTANDPIRNKWIGGVNVFGGGLALYNANGIKVGAIGVSGDTSCTDHVRAWKIRAALGLHFVPGGVSSGNTDAMMQDIAVDPATGLGVSAGGFGHPTCPNNPNNDDDGGSIEGN